MVENDRRGWVPRDPQPWRRRSSDRRKPPRGGGGQDGVPSWEKTFCKVAGSMDWQAFLYKKKFVHLFDDVLKWDDSAAEEGFHNAKNRFFAQMQGLHCDTSKLDPNLYAGEVDWNSWVDPELIMDLESPYMIPDTKSANHEPVLDFGDALLQQQGFSPHGWGVIEEGNKDASNSNTKNQWPVIPTGWGDEFEADPCKESLLKSGAPVKSTGWGDDFHDDPWQQSLPKNEEPVKQTGWGVDSVDVPWEKSLLPKSGEPVKATGWGDDGQSAEAAEWPTIQETSWSSRHPPNRTNWRGENYGAWGVKNNKKKQPSQWKNKGTRFHGDGIGQNKAACH